MKSNTLDRHWGHRKGKPWLTALLAAWQRYVHDDDPTSRRSAYRRRIVKAGDMVLEGKHADDSFGFPPKIAETAPEYLNLQPEDIILHMAPDPEAAKRGKAFSTGMKRQP